MQSSEHYGNDEAFDRLSTETVGMNVLRNERCFDKIVNTETK